MKKTKPKERKFAVDILSRTSTWTQALSDIRFSNLRVGQQITTLFKPSDDSNNGHVEYNNHDDGDISPFQPIVTKVLTVESENVSYILIGMEALIQVWKSYQLAEKVDYVTELIYELSIHKLIDACLCVHNQECLIYYLVEEEIESKLGLVNISTNQNAEVKIELAKAKAIAITKQYVFVASQSGFIKFYHLTSLAPIGEILSLQNADCYMTTSFRWIAVQVPRKSLPNLGSKESDYYDSDQADIGEAARKVVSGLYSFSKVVGNVIQYSYNKAVLSSSPPTESKENGGWYHPANEGGGGIVILDVHENITNSRGKPQPILLQSVHAHKTNISFMRFSPSGLRLASADENGQVITVHSLFSPGSLSSSHRVIYHPKNVDQRPQLLYRLVRGISLAKIVDIVFDRDESTVCASTFNGTVHIFDCLRATDTTSRSVGSSFNNGSFDGSPLTSDSNGISTSWSAPVTDVSQLLQIARPDVRTLQTYTDLRIKLPLSSHNPPRESQDSSSDKEKEKAYDISSYLPNEVNLLSASSIRFIDGVSRNQGLEILSCTSEGLLCRYKVLLHNKSTSVINNLNGNISEHGVTELNRWDLGQTNASFSSSGHGHVESPNPIVHEKKLYNNSLIQQPSLKRNVSNRSSLSISSNKQNSWLFSAGDFPESHEIPLWQIPQVTLLSSDYEVLKSKNSSSHSKKQSSDQFSRHILFPEGNAVSVVRLTKKNARNGYVNGGESIEHNIGHQIKKAVETDLLSYDDDIKPVRVINRAKSESFEDDTITWEMEQDWKQDKVKHEEKDNEEVYEDDYEEEDYDEEVKEAVS